MITAGDLKERTKRFAIRVIKLYASLSKDTISQVIGKQLVRSGTSVGAHYREASRARSNAEFISKIQVGIQELEETDYWLDLLIESEIITAQRLQPLRNELNELMAIFTASVKTAKKRKA